MDDDLWEGRGAPWEYDPGPPRNRRWPRLFAETPNHRGLGVAVTGGTELFRWHQGPMFYRGRLWDRQARVLVVGQEGAQDESLGHRAFVGGTGARMQHLLGHLGITRSYLFMNTFVYPILGQYDDDLRPLAQDPDSPIVAHRHELWDYLVDRTDLHLVIAVGRAAKESLATWIESHGGSADPERLDEADASVVAPGLRVVGVLHPGGGAFGGTSAIKASFVDAIEQVHGWAEDDPTWLPPDHDGQRRPGDDFVYRSAPIPFRDLPYGATWRLGRGGTSSNRRDQQRAIQVFSASGKYNNQGHSVSYVGDPTGNDDGVTIPAGDLAWEPPRGDHRHFDRGPDPAMARLLQGGDPDHGWPAFAALGLDAHPSFGRGPTHRGRLDHPGLLVLADQQDHDDLFTGRAMTGDAGQRLQAWLTAAGCTESYGIVRVLPVDTLGQSTATVRAVVDTDEVRSLHHEVMRRADPDVVVAVGPMARRLLPHVVPTGVPTVELRARSESGSAASWSEGLEALRDLDYRHDATPTFDWDGGREPIARHDLAFGTLWWQATSGDRAQRARRGGGDSFDYYKVSMPGWAAALDPPPLSPSEAAAMEVLRGDP